MDVEGERLRMATQLPSLLTTLISGLIKPTNVPNTQFCEGKNNTGREEGGRDEGEVLSGPDFDD